MATWPTSVSSNSNLYTAVNNLSTLLNGDLSNSATTVVVLSTTGFPSTGFISIDLEIIAYTGITSTTFTGCTRASDGTTASSHSSASTCALNVIAAHHNNLKDEVIALETSLDLTASKALQSNASGRVSVSTTTSTELGYVAGVTSALQTQIDGKLSTSGGTETGDVTFSNQKGIKLSEQTGNGTNFIKIIAPDAVTSDTTLKLPDGAGSSGQVLTTNGTGTLSWTTAASSGVTSIHADSNSNITGDARLVSGTNVTLTQSGQDITITAASGSGTTVPALFNPLINPNMEIWQRTTSNASLSNNTYTADRWIYRKSGTVTNSAVRFNSIIPTSSEANGFVGFSNEIDTGVALTLGAGDYVTIGQKIEGYNFNPFHNQQATLTFWVRATKTGTYCVAFKDTVYNVSYISTYTISASNTWEFKTITLTFNYSNVDGTNTQHNTYGIGHEIVWTLAAGTTYQTTAGTWQVGDFLATSAQVNAVDTISNKFYLTHTQLEIGASFTKFNWRPFANEVQLCQRYYWKTFDLDVTPQQNAGTNNGAIWYFAAVAGVKDQGVHRLFPVPMREFNTNSYTFYNPSNASAKWQNVGGGAESGTASATADGPLGVLVKNPQVGGDAQGDRLNVHMSVNGEL